MKKFKIIIILIQVIIILLLSMLMLMQKGNNNSEVSVEEEREHISYGQVTVLNEETMAFSVNSCINKYLTYLAEKNEQVILNLLDENYKTNNNITEDNVIEKIGSFNRYQILEIKEIYCENETENIKKYYVYGKIRDNMESVINIGNEQEVIEDDNETVFYDPDSDQKVVSEKKDIYLSIELDNLTMEYKICPLQKVEYKIVKDNAK